MKTALPLILSVLIMAAFLSLEAKVLIDNHFFIEVLQIKKKEKEPVKEPEVLIKLIKDKRNKITTTELLILASLSSIPFLLAFISFLTDKPKGITYKEWLLDRPRKEINSIRGKNKRETLKILIELILEVFDKCGDTISPSFDWSYALFLMFPPVAVLLAKISLFTVLFSFLYYVLLITLCSLQILFQTISVPEHILKDIFLKKIETNIEKSYKTKNLKSIIEIKKYLKKAEPTTLQLIYLSKLSKNFSTTRRFEKNVSYSKKA